MIAKTGRQNSDFQIEYFLAGRCHTPDGKYALLCDLRDNRMEAIANFHVQEKRARAREMRAFGKLEYESEADRLDVEADLDELQNTRERSAVLFKIAQDELAFINAQIEIVQPLRAFKHLPDNEAHQAMQREEWKRELLHRAQNFLFSHGTIPPDEMATMRAHPDFQTEIGPYIFGARQSLFAERALLSVTASANTEGVRQ